MRQPKWDKYEAALLIEAYWKIKKDPSGKESIVKSLSSQLRAQAKTRIDKEYRNINGIILRLAEMEYLFSEGKFGVKHTSVLFCVMVEMYLHNRKEYDKILSDAKAKFDENRPSDEYEQKDPKALEINAVDNRALDKNELGQEISILYSKDDSDDAIKMKLDLITSILQNRYKERPATSIREIIEHNRDLPVSNINAWAKRVEDLTTSPYLFAKGILVNNIDTRSEEEKRTERIHKLEDLTKILISRYGNRPAVSLTEIISNNSDLSVTSINAWVKEIYGITASDYLRQKGILMPLTEETISERLIETIDEIKNLLGGKQIYSLSEIDNLGLAAGTTTLNNWVKTVYGESLSEYLIKENILYDGKSEDPNAAINTMVDSIIENATYGITKSELCDLLPEHNIHQINNALLSCHAILVLDKYYHKNNIYDYQEMCDVLLEVITKQFSQNGDYTSAKQLYDEVRPRLDDFFFYNNAFDSRQEIYDLAVHLFEQERYKGNSFIFLNNAHIWRVEPDYPKSYYGLLIKYAREHGNTFTREDALSYLDQIGSANPSTAFSNMISDTSSTFLQYAENKFVLTEALRINDDFLSFVTTQIENLLEGEDYVATGEIDDYFYTTLPTLPSGIYWTALLLEDILRIYNMEFTTIEAGEDNDKKTIPAAIVRKNSQIKSFGDVVWCEISKSFSLPKEFTATEFRDFLLTKGFIRGSEKMWSVHKTVTGDIRFYWSDNNGKVTIS